MGITVFMQQMGLPATRKVRQSHREQAKRVGQSSSKRHDIRSYPSGITFSATMV